MQPSRIPVASNSPLPSPGKPRAIPSANLSNLSALSESSTGAWERGRQSGNARSPPASVSPLHKMSELSISGNGGASSASSTGSTGSGGRRASQFSHRTGLGSPETSYHVREGYGFRPASGHSTPTGSSQPGPSPFIPYFPAAEPARRHSTEEDDEDHRPDGRGVDALREEVKEELRRHGLNDGAALLPNSEGRGIADEEGLGWPGQWAVVPCRRH